MLAAAYFARQAFIAASEGAVQVSKPAIGLAEGPGMGVGVVVGVGTGVTVPVGVGAGQDEGGTVQVGGEEPAGGAACPVWAAVTGAAPGSVVGWGLAPDVLVPDAALTARRPASSCMMRSGLDP